MNKNVNLDANFRNSFRQSGKLIVATLDPFLVKFPWRA